MSKSIINQRLVYKIHSSRFKYNNWNLTLSFDEAKKNEEIVSLGDSTVLRMIRRLKNDNSDEYINKLKYKMKKTKDNIAIKRYSRDIDLSKFEKDYIIIVFDSSSDWKISNNENIPVILNGEEYVRLIGTNGGIKNNSVVFINKSLHKEIDKKLNNDRDLTKKYVPAKFEAYKALACSCSAPVTKPRGILVIKDGSHKIKDDVLRLSDNGKGGFDLKEVKDYEIDCNFTDGCGIISPSLARQWAIDLGEYHMEGDIKVENYIPSGFNIRGLFSVKGMLGTLDAEQFAREENNGNYMVKSIWGEYIDIRTVDLILTDNMVKLWDGYKNTKEFMECCDKNWFEISVAKMLPKELESTRNMNYQFLQSYDFSDKDIDELLKPTIDTIEGVIGLNNTDIDYGKMLLFLKGNKITEADFKKEEYDFIKALMINKEMINDPFVKQRVYKMIKKKINDSKKGVIQVDGNYSVIFGDLYALCQHMFGHKPTGLLNKGEFYSRTWLDKGVNEVVAFRAPMTIHNNIVKMKFVENEKINKYYKYMNTCIVFNIWGTHMEALNGADFDSDAVITTDNKVLVDNHVKLPVVVCEQKTSKKQRITKSSLIKANKNGFGNNVGKITNRCTSMFDVLAKFEKDTKEYNEMLYRITCMQGYQQEIIDSCKGIIPKQVPSEWYDFKTVKIKDDDDNEDTIRDKKYKLSLLANKKPYFFIYNYKHLKRDYEKYVQSSEDNCYLNFGITINELKNKENKSKEEQEFLYYYKILSPVSDNNSTMNKICHKLEQKFNNILPNLKNSYFDKSILMTDKKASKKIRQEIINIYNDYKKEVSKKMSSKYKIIKKEEINENRISFVSFYINKLEEICYGDYEIISNTLIDLYYDNPSSKQFIWDICGKYIVDLLLKRNNNIIHYPVKSDDGSISWNGEKYKLIDKEIYTND